MRPISPSELETLTGFLCPAVSRVTPSFELCGSREVKQHGVLSLEQNAIDAVGLHAQIPPHHVLNSVEQILRIPADRNYTRCPCFVELRGVWW